MSRRRRSYEELMDTVLIKHGITLGDDDPIMVLHTINAMLAADVGDDMDDALVKLRTELEALYLRWDSESKTRAQRIIAASLTTSQDALRQAVIDAGAEAAQLIQRAGADAVGAMSKASDRFTLWLQLFVVANVVTIVTICWAVFMTRH